MTFISIFPTISAASQTNESSTAATASVATTIKLESKDENKKAQVDQPVSSSSFAEIVTRLVMGKSFAKLANTNGTSESIEKKSAEKVANEISGVATSSPQNPPNIFKKACKPPSTRRFAHPCICSHPNGHPGGRFNQNVNINYTHTNSSTHPQQITVYSNPLHLYDPVSRKCLPVSKGRDMLLKDCHAHSVNSFSIKPHHALSCGSDDLICDPRRFKCTCKPPFHLYYDTTNSSQYPSFSCVPLGSTSSLDGRTNCRSGQVYNVISKECQKIFDINELPPYGAGVSATQFSFVTIVLIWILLLILIVTAKLRKLRTTNMYRNSPNPERRYRTGSHRQTGASAWMNPIIAAVNGHGGHLAQHRTTVDRLSQSVPGDGPGNYNDTDFFLGHGNRRNEGLLSDNFSGSHQSLNNPPPKFEEIYPARPEEQEVLKPPSNEELPTYDEAIKLQSNIVPLEPNQKE